MLVRLKRTTCNYVQNRRCDHPCTYELIKLNSLRARIQWMKHPLKHTMQIVNEKGQYSHELSGCLVTDWYTFINHVAWLLSGAALLEGFNGQRHPRCHENIWNLIYFLMCNLNLAYVLTKLIKNIETKQAFDFYILTLLFGYINFIINDHK